MQITDSIKINIIWKYTHSHIKSVYYPFSVYHTYVPFGYLVITISRSQTNTLFDNITKTNAKLVLNAIVSNLFNGNFPANYTHLCSISIVLLFICYCTHLLPTFFGIFRCFYLFLFHRVCPNVIPFLLYHISADYKIVACCSPRRGVWFIKKFFDLSEQRRELPLPLFCL